MRSTPVGFDLYPHCVVVVGPIALPRRALPRGQHASTPTSANENSAGISVSTERLLHPVCFRGARSAVVMRTLRWGDQVDRPVVFCIPATRSFNDRSESDMKELTRESTLADWIIQEPQIASVFERHHLDYCCHGQRTLEDACAERGLSSEEVISDIRKVQNDVRESESNHSRIDWSQHSLSALCDHIEQTHHALLRQQIPRLDQLLSKVIAAHHEHHPELAELQPVFRALAAELGPHLMKEEQVLFPAIRRIERESELPHFPFGSVRNPIRVMEHEHDTAGQLLAELRKLTDGYDPPPDACASWVSLWRGLHELEVDLHEHIHKENNILFPAAAARAAQ